MLFVAEDDIYQCLVRRRPIFFKTRFIGNTICPKKLKSPCAIQMQQKSSTSISKGAPKASSNPSKGAIGTFSRPVSTSSGTSPRHRDRHSKAWSSLPKTFFLRFLSPVFLNTKLVTPFWTLLLSTLMSRQLSHREPLSTHAAQAGCKPSHLNFFCLHLKHALVIRAFGRYHQAEDQHIHYYYLVLRTELWGMEHTLHPYPMDWF